MKTCVVGGAGFIGRVLTGLLVGLDREVTVLGRSPQPARPLPAGVRYQPCAGASPQELAHALRGCDELVDLAYATMPNTSFKDPIFDIQANLPFAVGLLQAAVAAEVKRMVIVSSGGTVYGRAQELPIAETHPTQPLSPYGITKLTLEKYALMYHLCHGVPVMVVRPANAYGEEQNASQGQGFVAAVMARVAAGAEVQIFGPQGTVRDYIHVSDVARGIAAALLAGTPGEIYNIGTGSGRNNMEVLEAVCRVAAVAPESVHVRFLPARPFDVPANVLDASKLRRQTGWEPQISFASGLAACWERYKVGLAGS